MTEELVPTNIEAEQALLGAILHQNEAYHRTVGIVSAEHFYEPVHRTIFEAIERLVKAGRNADPITLKTNLPAMPEDAGITMSQYLARLMTAPATIFNAPDYARAIRDASVRRSLIMIGDELIIMARRGDNELDGDQQIEEAEKSLHDLAKAGRVGKGFLDFSAALTDAITNIAEAYKRDGGLSGLGTGLSDLDYLMGGLQKSDLIVLAGRPAMGKTALATNIAFHIAKRYRPVGPDGVKAEDGGRVAFYSLEMSAGQLATRILAEEAEIPASALRRGDIREDQFRNLVDAARAMEGAALKIDDKGGVSVHQLAASARRLARTSGVDLIVIDYLQLLSGSRKAGDNRVQELTEITTTLKALAKELDVPIIALSQLSRQVEQREDKHPQLSDLRESGSIEQDADVVLFVYREEYYLKMAEPKEGTADYMDWEAKMAAAHGRAEVIIGKQRHGPTGTAHLSFTAAFTKFGNLAHEERLPQRMAS